MWGSPSMALPPALLDVSLSSVSPLRLRRSSSSSQVVCFRMLPRGAGIYSASIPAVGPMLGRQGQRGCAHEGRRGESWVKVPPEEEDTVVFILQQGPSSTW